MSWEEQLFTLFDDLEQQAESLFQAERDLEIADRAQGEYTQVTLASRLMASVDEEIVLQVAGVGAVRGVLQRVAGDWCLVAGGGAGQDWVVRLAAVSLVRGASERSFPEAAWPAVAKLGFGSALRRIAQSRERCHLHLVDGTQHDVRLLRVGQDFVEAAVGDESPVPALFAFTTVSAVQKRAD